MTTFYPRSAWTAIPRPVNKLVRLNAATLLGVAIHYTGEKHLGQTTSVELSARRLEGERRFHTDPPPDGRGWSDIAYGTAFDQAGNVFDCRGIDWRSAANGSSYANTTYGAVTFLLGVDDRPTPAMIMAFREWRTNYWLKRWPNADKVVGHRDLYATECPGLAYDLVRNGALLIPASAPNASMSREDDMPSTEEIVNALLAAKPFGRQLNVGTLIARSYEQSAYNTMLLQVLTDGSDAPTADAIAEALAGKLGVAEGRTVSLADVKRAVREVLIEGTGETL